MQSAAGLVLASELARLKSSTEEKHLTKAFLPVALLISVVGLIASSTHLASPLSAIYVLNNVFISPLSLEIFCAVSFIGCLFLACVLRYFKNPLGDVLGLITAVLGLLMIWSIANVYMQETLISFDTPGTLMVFLGTGLLMGAALASLLYAFALKQNDTLETEGNSATVFLAMAILGLGLGYLGAFFNAPVRDGYMMSNINPIILLTSICLPVVGLIALIFGWFTNGKESRSVSLGSFSLLAVVFVMVGEFCGRYIFYESFLRLGV